VQALILVFSTKGHSRRLAKHRIRTQNIDSQGIYSAFERAVFKMKEHRGSGARFVEAADENSE